MAKFKTRAELVKFWSKMPDKIFEKLQRAMNTNAKELQTAVSAAAPVDSGVLKANIKIKDKSEGRYIKHTIHTDGGEASHAAHVEFGTQKMDADPFFFPTYRVLRPIFKRRNKSAIRRGMKAARK